MVAGFVASTWCFARMASFFAVILLVSLIGISIWIIMAAVGKKWASWQE